MKCAEWPDPNRAFDHLPNAAMARANRAENGLLAYTVFSIFRFTNKAPTAAVAAQFDGFFEVLSRFIHLA
jgi:hypothetical protein